MNRPFERIPRWLRLTPGQWAVVIGAAVLAALVGYVVQSQKEDSYAATARVLFRTAELDRAIFGSPVLSGSGEPERDAATNTKLIVSNSVAERVAEVAGLPASQADELRSRVSVGSSGNSDIADITMTDANAARAAILANAWAEQFVQTRIEADRAKVQQSLDAATDRVDQLRAQGASEEELARLQQQLDDLRLLADVQTGNVEILDRATPPSAPEQASPAQVALGVGLLQGLLGLALMAGYRRLRDPVNSADDLQGLNLPVLAELPRVQRVPIARGARSSEGFDSSLRLLLGNLKFVATPGTGATVTAVQSTRPGEGKSTIAFHLARVAARSGSRVCLIDADLRFRTITRGVGEPYAQGLSNLLSALSATSPAEMGSSVDDAIVSVERFDLLAAGPQPPNPGDLAVREVVPNIIEILRHRYDLVIIDAPPFLGLPDAARFLQAADSVVIVVRRRAARLYQVRRLIDRLKVLGAKPVGTVLNMSAPRDEDLAYGYPEAPAVPRAGRLAPSPPRPAAAARALGGQPDRRPGRRPEDEDGTRSRSTTTSRRAQPPAGENGRPGDTERPEPQAVGTGVEARPSRAVGSSLGGPDGRDRPRGRDGARLSLSRLPGPELVVDGRHRGRRARRGGPGVPRAPGHRHHGGAPAVLDRRRGHRRRAARPLAAGQPAVRRLRAGSSRRGTCCWCSPRSRRSSSSRRPATVAPASRAGDLAVRRHGRVRRAGSSWASTSSTTPTARSWACAPGTRACWPPSSSGGSCARCPARGRRRSCSARASWSASS